MPFLSPCLPEDVLLSSYEFDLPEEQIAQVPAGRREQSRLLVLDRTSGATRTDSFAALGAYLPEGALLVANNSRVVPARVLGTRPTGGRMELLLLTPVPLLSILPAPGPDRATPGDWHQAEAEALLRSSHKARPGEWLEFSPSFRVLVQERKDYGRCRVTLFWPGRLEEVLDTCGTLPLPPYIRRSRNTERPEEQGVCAAESRELSLAAQDRERYQTTYARDDKAGSVAAPTAGLHFTPELRASLEAAGHEWAEVTLYVGYGTFSPVRSEDIREHVMHAEYIELPETTVRAIARARREGRPVIAVGTTSARVLEGAARAVCAGKKACSLAPYAGWTDIFLYPGQRLHVVDGLITNFHLPRSSLLMLVAALTGREKMLAAYRQAVALGFRFFSYGDAMLIL